MNPKEDSTRNGMEVAVIGMAGRFPGAKDIDEFWENLKLGKESITFFNNEELIEAGVSPVRLNNPNYIKARGILANFEYFDAFFFDYTLGEASVMSPQMRLFHECIWTALENAGYVPELYKGRIGLYAGASTSSYWETLVFLALEAQEQKTQPGKFALPDMFSAKLLSNKDSINTHLSYKLNLTGPSYSIQTACSTSLAAVHMAVQGLLNGECEIALAGGTALNTTPRSGYFYQEGMIMSPDGHTRAFDKQGKGTINSDGVGATVLKLLENALEDGDYIYAIIKGSAANNDGSRKVGYLAPSVQGQVEVISTAQYIAEVDPETITYIESHGTATELGDVVEVEALKTAFNTTKKGYCAIGSVKSNFGHLDAAAGVAGFVKTVLALHYGLIPPSLHYESPNSKIDFANSPFYVNTKLKEWKCEGYPRRAGVSSFGIGGTNAHVVLEEYTKQFTGSETLKKHSETSDNKYRLLLLSARTESALAKMADNLAGYLKKNLNQPVKSDQFPINIEDIAYTLQVGRKAFKYRKFLVCQDSEVNDAIEILSSVENRKVQNSRVEVKNRPLVFMFPGLGSEYKGMGAGLYQAEPVFRDEMNYCFKIIKSLTGCDITEEHANNPTEIPLRLFAVEYALTKLLMKCGIQPNTLIGYSLGEYTAACISGVLSPEDALKLIVARTKLLQRLPTGMMLSVPLTREQLEPLLPTVIPGNLIGIAIDNGPSCIVAGPLEVMADFQQQMQKKQLICIRVNTTQGIHSPLMDPILEEFQQIVSQIQLKKPAIPYISNVTGQLITDAEAVNPRYWARHMRETVRFADGIAGLLNIKNVMFVEVGPGGNLNALTARFIEKKPTFKTISLLRQSAQSTADELFFLTRLGHLWLHGISVDWQQFHAHEKRQRLPLPTYPFEGRLFPIPTNFFQKISAALSPQDLEDLSRQMSPAEINIEKTGANIFPSKPILSTAYIAPRDLLEQNLADIWQRNLGLEKIGIHDNFFELGGDSLKGAMLINQYQKLLEEIVPISFIFDFPTIAELADNFTRHYPRAAERIRKEKKFSSDTNKEQENGYTSIQPVEKKEYYIMSSAQERIYILQQMDPASTAYNVTLLVELIGQLRKERLEETFKKLVARHESFRTAFITLNEEVVQKIYEEVDFTVDIQKEDEIYHFICPFNLSYAPLLRVGLIKKSEEQHILMADMHHIISDGTSVSVLAKEFIDLYGGKELTPLRIQYKDYTVWQNSEKEKKKSKEQEAWWLQEFSGEIPVLNLPLDYHRPAMQRFEGRRKIFYSEPGELEALKRLAHEQGGTLYMLLLGIYSIFLYKLSGQPESVIGTPVANRRHSDLETVIGMFINTLAVRAYPEGDKVFNEFLSEIIEKMLVVFENQEYPFEDLVEKAAINRDTGRNPLFDVIFLLQNIEIPEITTPELKIKPYAYENNTAKFDLTLQAFETKTTRHEVILRFSLEYSTQLFNPETIERFISYYKKILTAIIRDPGQKIACIEIISAAEKRQILEDFNKAAVEYPRDKTIHQLFAERVQTMPDRVALVGADLCVCPDRNVLLTYNELNDQSNQLAQVLIEKGVGVNDIVGIMMERSISLITGILGILKTGSAYLPIDPGAPKERVNYILRDSDAKFLLNKSEMPIKLHHANVVLSSESVLNSEPLDSNSPNLAYIIYTSGSTGIPKGVPIAHANLCPLLHWGYDFMNWKPEDHVVQSLAYYFDWSVWEIFLAITAGSSLYIIPDEILLSGWAQLDFIRKHDITVMEMTPTQFQALIASDPKPQALNTLKCLCLGAEKLTVNLVRHARELITKDCRIFNLYGPTEAAIISAALAIDTKVLDKYAGLSSIPIGKMSGNGFLLVLDKYFKSCPVQVMGELYISGDGLAPGYLNNPELTAEKFKFNTCYRSYRSYKTYILYKTGDLARWLIDGNIEFLGRIDHQVKIRGFRIELGEIEYQLQQHSNIKEAVVDLNGAGDNKYLCAYIVFGSANFPTPTTAELKHYLAKVLPDYMIPSFFIAVDQMPLTPNGKINRRALPEPGAGNKSKQYIAPRNNIEEKLVTIWAEVLGIEKNSINIDDNFFELGGHSLKATILLSKIHKFFAVKLLLTQFFMTPTIRELAEYIKINAKAGEHYTWIEAVEKKEYYALSPAQLRLYILQQMDPLSTVYNMPLTAELAGPLQKERLEKTFKKLIARHESLRTSFFIVNEEVVQKMHEEVDFEIVILEEVKYGFIQPFTLANAPLIRVGLIKLEKEKHILIVDMHHIISDAISLRVSIQDFMLIYTRIGEDKDLESLTLHYKDYCEWWKLQTCKEAFRRQETYWLQQFKTIPPVLDLPCDYPRPQFQCVNGSSLNFKIEKKRTEALKKYALKENVTLQMMLKAIFHILLAKLSGLKDIVTGTTIAGRRHVDLEKIIGLFVNTLPIRTFPTDEKIFKHYLKEVKDNSLNAYENQDYPFDSLVKKISVQRSDRNPIFDIMFELQLAETGTAAPMTLEIADLKIRPLHMETKTTKFEQDWLGLETPNGIEFTVSYALELYRPETIELMTEQFLKLVDSVIANPLSKIDDLDHRTSFEKELIPVQAVEFNF